MSLEQYKSLFVTVENVDHFQINSDLHGQECYFSVSLGENCLKSACATIPSAEQLARGDVPMAFDSILTFPFNYTFDKDICVHLKDKANGNVMGTHILKSSLFENRDSSLSARMKLKSAAGSTVGYLNAKITLSTTSVPRPSAARFVRADNNKDGMQNEMSIPDVVPLFDESRHSTRSIQCTVYQIEDPNFEAKLSSCELSLDALNLRSPSVGRSFLRGTNVFSFNKTFVFPYAGERFLKFKVFGNDHAVGSGAIDLANFVTKRQNVIAGALAVETENGHCVGELFFRMERFQSKKKMEMNDDVEFGANVNPLNHSVMSNLELRSY